MANVEVEVAPAIDAISPTPTTLEDPPLSKAPVVDEPSATISETPEDNKATIVSADLPESKEVEAVEEKQDEGSAAVDEEVEAEVKLASEETEVKEKTGEDSEESPPEEVVAEDVKAAAELEGEEESAEVGVDPPLPKEEAEEEKDDVAE